MKNLIPIESLVTIYPNIYPVYSRKFPLKMNILFFILDLVLLNNLHFDFLFFLFQNSTASIPSKLNNSSSSYSRGSQDLFESRSHAAENRMMMSSSMGGQQRTYGSGGSMGGQQIIGGQQRMVQQSSDFFEQSKIVTKSSSGGKSKTYG